MSSMCNPAPLAVLNCSNQYQTPVTDPLDSLPAGELATFGYLRGSCKAMQDLYHTLQRLADADVSVLLVGESGTGKELAARTLHTLSRRASAGPFVAFNCGAVPTNLIESELFGHEKGSFSGATKRHVGFFERANRGTLLLDEITEMDHALQVKFLRVLENRVLRRVGSEEDISFETRVISSTNRIPEQAIEDGVLREDLYYRIAHISVQLPALRERGDDIEKLARHFLGELNQTHDTDIQFTDEAMDAITRYQWPGNVRELKHAVECAYIFSEKVIKPEELPLRSRYRTQQSDQQPVQLPDQLAPAGEFISVPLGESLSVSQRTIIARNLANNNGNKKITAKHLGISLKTLYNRLNQYGEP